MAAATHPLPESSVTELSPGTAFAATGITDVVAMLAPSSKGTVGAPMAFNAGDIDGLVAAFGTGPGIKEMARAAALVSAPFVFERLTTASVAASKSSPTVTSATMAGFVALSGTALEGGDYVITCTTTGTTGTSFGYTLTKGGVVGSPVAVTTGLAITTGLDGITVTLTTGKVFTIGDTIEWLQMPASSTVLTVATTLIGSSTSARTVTGTPNDAYEVRVEFLGVTGSTTATVSTALAGFQYRYTLNASDPSPVYTAWANLGAANTITLIDGPISTEPTGLTFNLGAGTIDSGDFTTWKTTPPAYDSAGATVGITNLRKWKGGQWTWLRLVGPVSKATAATIEPLISGLDAYGLPSWGVCDTRDRGTYESLTQWETGINGVQQEWIPYTSTHLAFAAGMARMSDGGINGRSNRRSVMASCLPRAMGLPLQQNWGQFDLESLPADVSISDSANVTIEHDADVSNSLNSIGAITLRTWPGEIGVWPTNAPLPAPTGDIVFIPLRRVANVAKKIQNAGQRLQVLKNFTVVLRGAKPQTINGYAPLQPGDLDAQSIKRINRVINQMIAAAIVSTGMVQAATYKVGQTPLGIGGGSYRLTGALALSGFITVVEFDGTAQFVTAAS